MRRLQNNRVSATLSNALRPRVAMGAAVVLMLGLGCESTAPPEPVLTVAITSPAPVLLVPGGVETVVTESKGASGKVLTGRAELWSSSDESVARVVSGLVTGVAKGVATITVSVEGKTASTSVEVRDGQVVGAAGASFSVLDGAVTVAVPAGAVATARNISVKAAANPPPARRYMPGTAYEFGPDGATFAQPVKITIKYDPATISPDSPESGLQLYEVVAGAWRVVPESGVDKATRTVSGNVSHFSTYGILMQPIVDTVRVNPPPASIVVKTSFTFTATIKDSAGATLTRPVTWATSAANILQIDPNTGVAQANIPGTVTITATSEKKSGTLSVTVVPGPAAHMLRVTSATVSGAAGVALASPPAVQITDEFGNGIPNFTVTFAVASGGGSLVGATATTNPNGFTSPTSWILGTVVGTNTVTASAPNLPESPMTFTAIGNPGPAATITAVSAISQSGTAGGIAPAPPSVKVVDAFNNVVPGIKVTFAPASGSGTLAGATPTTNSSGIATVDSWKLGQTPGTQTVTATLAGVTGSPVTFTAAAAAPIPSSMVVAAGDGQTAVTLSNVAIAPAVKITDPAGVPVPGMTVTFAVASGGGSITGGSAVTNSDGIAVVGSWTMGPNPGANTLTASAGTLSNVTFNATAIAPIPVALAIVAGQNQTSVAGADLPIAPSVKVTDAQGRGVPNIDVVFTITGGGGSLTGGTTTTNSSGIATLGSWKIGIGTNTLTASTPGRSLSGSPATFISAGVPVVQLVTFGDSNTDRGYSGSNPQIQAASYVSNDSPQRLAPNAQNSPFQLAGKIENKWRSARSETIKVTNHGITSTRTGTGKTGLGSPNALEVVNGLTRFEGEVLGLGYPWSGGEPANSAFPNGPIARVQAFRPRPQDWVYVSLGTNDLANNVNTDNIAANLSRLVDMWVGAGLPASHFIITTAPPRDPATSKFVPGLNVAIRSLAAQRGIRLIELSTFLSADDGISWRDPSLHVGDFIHYSETVRTWLADRVFEIISAP